MKRKILYVITKSGWGGAQQYVYELATSLPQKAFEPIIAGGGSGLLFDKLRGAEIRTIAVPGLRRDVALFGEIAAVWNLVRIFIRERPDVIHLSSSKAGALGAVAAFLFKLFTFNFKPPVIFTVHGWGFNEDRPLLERTLILLASWISGLLQNRLILIDTPDYTSARRFLPNHKLVLIPHGLRAIPFLSRKEARMALAQAIGRPLPDDAVLIGTIAELARNKGLSYLISGLSKLPPNTINYYRGFASIVIGEGEERQKLQQQIDSLGLRDTVHLAGFIPDAARLLKGFDIFALPSVKEGLPYTLMAAMAAGLPAVATRVGGIPDLITDRIEGLLVPPKDPAALARAITALAASAQKRTGLGNAAQRKIETKFPFRAMMERTLSVYNDSHVPPSVE